MLHFTAPLVLLVASAIAAENAIPIERFDVNDVNDMKKWDDECKLGVCYYFYKGIQKLYIFL